MGDEKKEEDEKKKEEEETTEEKKEEDAKNGTATKKKKTKKKKKKVHRVKLGWRPMSHAAPTHMSKKGKQASSRLLNDLKQEDELRALKSELKNDLESYVFKTRSFIRENEDELSKVSEEEEREGILADLEVLEDWLYEDGEDGGADAEVPVYKKKRKDMDKRVNSIKQRLLELELRPKAVEAARAIIKSIGATIETFPTLRPQILPTMIEELKN